jgi:hypothetical protein
MAAVILTCVLVYGFFNKSGPTAVIITLVFFAALIVMALFAAGAFLSFAIGNSVTSKRSRASVSGHAILTPCGY